MHPPNLPNVLLSVQLRLQGSALVCVGRGSSAGFRFGARLGWLLGWCALLLQLPFWALAQASSDSPPLRQPFPHKPVFVQTPLTAGLLPVLDLNRDWYQDGVYQPQSVPFLDCEATALSLLTDFYFADFPQDTFFLYLEGIAWVAEIYLNKRLLWIHRQPFEPLLLPLPPSVLRSQWNQLNIRMRIGALAVPDSLAAWYPRPCVGIHKPVYLLGRGQPQPRTRQDIDTVPRADTSAMPRTPTARSIFTPYYTYAPDSVLIWGFGPAHTQTTTPNKSHRGWNPDSLLLLQLLPQLRAQGVRHIAWVNPPTPSLRVLLSHYGIAEVPLPRALAAPWLARVLDYGPLPPSIQVPTWFDSHTLQPTEQMGSFATTLEPQRPPLARFYLLLQFLIPLMFLALIRGLAPRYLIELQLLQPVWQSGLNFLRDNANNYLGQAGLVVALRLLIEILLLASLWTWVYRFAPQLHAQLPSWISLPQLHSQWPTEALSLAFGAVVVVLTQFYRLLCLALIQFSYQLRDFILVQVQVNSLASFPLNLLALFALFISLLPRFQQATYWHYLALILLLVYALFRLLVIFQALRTLWRTPYIANVLYICVVELLPWLLLLSIK